MPAARLRFGAFELDPQDGELRKSGVLLKLRPQPFKVLVLLVNRPGELITREEIQKAVWGEDTVVDFDKGVNFCVGQIRAVLGDDADTPRFIETVPRRGYRFLGPVERLEAPAKAVPVVERPRQLLWSGIVAVALAAVGVYWFASSRPSASFSSVAVLPFVNLSTNPENEYFADGLTDDIISALTRIEGLRVPARTSAFVFKGKAQNVSEIGAKLKVEAVLEGSVRRDGSRIRISAQLIGVRDGYHLWSETYDRQIQDLFAVQDDISRSIMHALKFRLAGKGARSIGKPTENFEAYTLYLKGRHFGNSINSEGLKKCADYLERAVAQDPNFALAYAALSDCYIFFPWHRVASREQAFPKAEAAALKAIQLDDSLAEAHTSLAHLWTWQRDWAGADREFHRALELNPNYAKAHDWRAVPYLSALGRLDEALYESRRALELDPLSPIVNSHLGQLYYYSRQYDRAIEQLRKTIELDPNFSPAHARLGQAYVQKGMYAEAIAELERSRELSGDSMSSARIVLAYALWGKREEAKKRLTGDCCTALAALGQKDRAFACLEAKANRDAAMMWLKVDPEFDPLRSDPRFEALMKKVGLEK